MSDEAILFLYFLIAIVSILVVAAAISDAVLMMTTKPAYSVKVGDAIKKKVT